ncbi:hypothetical protein GN956_G17272 [Arapaima gigas]
MSPIAHVWDDLDRRIQRRVPAPPDIRQVVTAVAKEQDNIHRGHSHTLASPGSGAADGTPSHLHVLDSERSF